MAVPHEGMYVYLDITASDDGVFICFEVPTEMVQLLSLLLVLSLVVVVVGC